jgi:hypothetical protein
MLMAKMIMLAEARTGLAHNSNTFPISAHVSRESSWPNRNKVFLHINRADQGKTMFIMDIKEWMQFRQYVDEEFMKFAAFETLGGLGENE